MRGTSRASRRPSTGRGATPPPGRSWASSRPPRAPMSSRGSPPGRPAGRGAPRGGGGGGRQGGGGGEDSVAARRPAPGAGVPAGDLPEPAHACHGQSGSRGPRGAEAERQLGRARFPDAVLHRVESAPQTRGPARPGRSFLKGDPLMITRREFVKGAAAVTGSLGFPAVLRAQPKEILVGETHPLTGGLAREGNLGKNGIEFAVHGVNAGGGIKSMGGAKLKLMALDNESKPPVAISTIEKLKDAGAVAILGPYASGLAFVTTQEAEKYKIPHVLDVAIADQITEPGFKYTFRACPNAGMGAKHTVDYLGAMAKDLKLSVKRVVLIHEDGIFGKSTADTLQRLLPGIGLDVVERIPHNAATQSLANEVLRIKAAKADIVIPSTYYGPHSLLLRTIARSEEHTSEL